MVIGHGDVSGFLTEDNVKEIMAQGLDPQDVRGKKIVFIIPDNTRTCPMPMFFRSIAELYAGEAEKLDFLIALGTHLYMSEDQINDMLGVTAEERKSKYSHIGVYNHEWKDPETFTSAGIISAEEMNRLTAGYITDLIDVKINKMIFDYDRIVIVGPVFPHEVIGFSGGNKYFFPGISQGDMINFTHWLGALHTLVKIIGYKDTPVRRVVDRAASFVDRPKTLMAMVSTKNGLKGLYVGEPVETWSKAADLSKQVHILYFDKPFQRVLSCAPTMYKDIWLAGKCMYKLEPVVADGGELIIYAPHIDELSYSHRKEIEEIGYHVRDYFVKQEERFRHIPGGIKAHSTHVKGAGRFESNKEEPRVTVTLATQLPEDYCKKINLGYTDFQTIDPREWEGRRDEGVLLVPHAGEMLHRLRGEE